MASSSKGKPDSHLRLVSDEEAVVLPEGAHHSDDSPTVISRTVPIVDATANQNNIVDLARKREPRIDLWRACAADGSPISS